MSVRDEMNAFRGAHPARKVTVVGVEWEYLVCGTGEPTVLMLHGGTGSAVSLFRYVQPLERDFRVILPTVPTRVTRVDDALIAIQAILEAEGVSAFHGVGFSLGGMLLQTLVRRQPERVRSLVLFHCPPPGAAYAATLERRAARANALPGWLARPIIRRHLMREFSKYPASEAERAFWLEFYGGAFGERSLSHVSLVVDYLRHQQFNADDLERWEGEVLIIETATDEIIPREERERLKALYPLAQVHTFHTGSHLGNGLFELQTTVPLIARFLSRAGSGGRSRVAAPIRTASPTGLATA